MDIFDVLSLIGGLCLFLFGMNLMGQALEKRAGSSLRTLLGKLTTGKAAGFLTGLAVTAVIQSSSATTVMVVGFVNSGIMKLGQAINVIMGANVGTTVTAWLLSLAGIDSKNVFIRLLKPTSFTPVLALIGIIFYMFCKSDKKKDTGTILLGFATLMFGMDAMSGAVSGLKNVPEFQNLFIMFTNPVLGVLAGAVLTAIIQSSSASVGILQALAATGQVSYGAAIPIIMGQNIGTCVTAMISSVGTTKNAKRAAVVHLSFNIIGTVVWLVVFSVIRAVFAPALLNEGASMFGIAGAHSVFNVLCTLLLLPMTKQLETLACRLVPDAKEEETLAELDERLFATPALALEQCSQVAADMAACSVQTLRDAISVMKQYDPALAEAVREGEEKADHYEDILSSYLVKLSALPISEGDSAEAAMLLKVITDFERISDYGVNILYSAEELQRSEHKFSETALAEMDVLTAALDETLEKTLELFRTKNFDMIYDVAALKRVFSGLKRQMRTNHIHRLQKGSCSADIGSVWLDLLTYLKRSCDHCANVAGGMLDLLNHDMNTHENLRAIKRDDEEFLQDVERYSRKYVLN